MSEFRVEVVRIGAIDKHPNADSLSVTNIHGGYPVIFRTGDFSEGDLAVYVPVDAVVPADDPRWAFLGGHLRIRAKRLRGIFSMGLLTPLPDGVAHGAHIAEALRIAKYEPPEQFTMGGENEAGPSIPCYDIEGLRRYQDILIPGEGVWITEKIHGANARFMHDGKRLWVGSRTAFKRMDADNLWWKVAKKYDLEKLAHYPNVAFYGEVYGQVQDLKYGSTGEVRLALFDILDTATHRWFDPSDFLAAAEHLGLPVVPTLFLGQWDPSLASLAEGSSVMPGADHVREGIVVKPMKERTDPLIGRVFLKLHGEGFLTRKERK